MNENNTEHLEVKNFQWTLDTIWNDFLIFEEIWRMETRSRDKTAGFYGWY